MQSRVKQTVVGAMVILFAVVACGKSDSPKAVTVDNLKYPHSLRIVDEGNGDIKLEWIGSNFEKGFQGYNVYGAKMTDDQIAQLAQYGLVQGQPIQLLDDEGKARDESKEIMKKFNFDPENPFTAASEDDTAEDDEKKISYLPIHEIKDKKPLLPSCYPNDENESLCDPYTGSVKKLPSSISLNGKTEFKIEGLVPGEQYCFMVFSVTDGGKKISQTSSEFECIIPAFQLYTNKIFCMRVCVFDNNPFV